ncbi:MAG: tyrosine recombinase XerC [Tissierellia bacterium]|nr:tyrosine recombinase XerC [Tissierellia bacterium]
MIYSNLLDDFLSYMKSTKGSSDNTMREYYYDIRMFLRFLKIRRGYVDSDTLFDDIEIDDIDVAILKTVTKRDIYAYNSYLGQTRKISNRSKHRKITSVRRFFHYLTTKVDLLDENPLDNIDLPTFEKTLPVYLSLEEAKALLETALHSKQREVYKRRDYAILTLFLNCGLRLSELQSIDIDHIEKDHTLRVMGKGKKERTIYLNQACVQALEMYLSYRPQIKDSALFLSQRQKRMSNRAIQHMIEKHIVNTGLDPKKYSVHKLRHTAATLMYQYGNADILSLQEILGHESVTTTQIYTHIKEEHLRATLDNNPLGDYIVEDERPKEESLKNSKKEEA